MSEEKYRTLFDSIDEGYCIIQMMHDEAGKAYDWRFLEVNRAFELNNGLKNAEGKTIRELAPDIEPKWMEIYDRVAQTGVPLRFEEDSQALGRNFSLYTFRIGEKHEGKVAVIFTDISQRKRAEKARRESEQRLSVIFTQAAVGLSEISLEGRFVRVNDELCRMLGRSHAELLKMGIADVTHSDDIAPSFAKVRTLIETGQPISIDKRYLHSGGGLVYANSAISLLVTEAGEAESILAVTVDLTARKLMEEGLRESEERFRLLVEGTEDYAMFLMDNERRIIHWNVGAERVFGWSRDEIIGQTADIIFTPEDRETGQPGREAQTAMRKGRAIDCRWHIRKDGSRFWADGIMSCLHGEAKQIRGFVKIARDMTRQRENAIALQKAHDEMEARVVERTLELGQLNTQLRRHAENLQQIESERQLLLQRLVVAQEEERKRISRELHDQMGQSLTALKVGLSNILNDNQEDFAERFQKLNHLIDDLTQQVHNLAWELRPAVLDNLGLETAVQQVVGNWAQQSGIAADFASRGFTHHQRLLPHIESAFYRVIQEALTNVQKHADATLVSVVIERVGNEVRAIVEDNGKGIAADGLNDIQTKSGAGDMPVATTQRLGLIGMRERMELIGGRLQIESEPGKGTTIYARAPFEQQRDG